MIDLTHIISVYSKQDYLPDTIHSLLNQETNLVREFIFVDDCSTDDSVAIIRQCTQNAPNVRIITNQDNRGPSARLNQGALIAKGQFLHFLDHDDIVPKNGIDFLYRNLIAQHADFIYGTWQKTGLPGSDLLNKSISQANVSGSNSPLETVLTGRFKRMCTITTKELYLKAGGCDERIFIQDESLPIRLAAHANRIAVTDAVVNLVPLEFGNLSQNKSQLNHDRFLAYYYALNDRLSASPKHQNLMFKRAISAAWKQQRDTATSSLFSKLFLQYLLSKIGQSRPPLPILEELHKMFGTLPNVRRAQSHDFFLAPATSPAA